MSEGLMESLPTLQPELTVEREIYFAVSVIYEYLITLDLEMQAVWRQRWTASSVLLLSIRWVMIFTAMAQCVALLPYVIGLICRLPSILADLLVVIVTWRSTFQHWKKISRPLSTATISSCLLRDGTIYFLALLLVNVAEVLTHHPTFNPVSVLLTSMPPVLVNRFMLNLRQVHFKSSFQSYSAVIPSFHPRHSETDYGTFTSIIGNIGEPLLHGYDEETEERTSPAFIIDLRQNASA
ncbi:uncharacterized protein PHACADRAFT_212866 [Phanerochaete carnosa HHB-10118-sp]|uniref:DUF6533 domain-containing protein n=1 Tax=Phanerochaete carnosa (strain HHB-10118-sp) TaxID=650164 RepID=K5VI77_PHACS|nr:uncharacterized protein PHACADRAFT_212866 [Phanerochaete carnosa HHB-10118-sp]EKM50963.1 hypothetical protein PHACADRAFT_212866 [Phanerochaete carnosa HHB-10118-sp]